MKHPIGSLFGLAILVSISLVSSASAVVSIDNAGAYGANSDSFFGTNDQGGNVKEWIDAVLTASARAHRGGSFSGGNSISAVRLPIPSQHEAGDLGFRVASVPEPSCLLLTFLASGGLLIRRKR